MEAAYEILLLSARLFAVGLLLFLAWSIGVTGRHAVSRGRRNVDELRARSALAEREVRNGLRGATSAMRTARGQLDSLTATDR